MEKGEDYMGGRMNDITLIYPHQLFRKHPAVKTHRHAALIEDPFFFGGKGNPMKFHKHKLILHRATMKMYASRLKKMGITVRYCDYSPKKTSADILKDLIKKGYDEFHLTDVTDHRLVSHIEKAAGAAKISMKTYDSPLFLTPLSVIEDFFADKKHFLMASFYQAQRKRLNILMDNGRPVGGKWSYDVENRKKIPRGLAIPSLPKQTTSKFVNEACTYVEKHFPRNYGDTRNFWYPVSHKESMAWLSDFLENRLALFGDYEDAIVAHESVLFHSVLTPVLNIGLLTPEDIIGETMKYSEEEKVPLNSLEGFVRQIIGWREFIRAMYEKVGEEQRSGNFWNHDRPLPKAFYNGKTGVDPVDTVIRRVLDRSWCHHIERLMILGNFMLLCGIKPDDVYRWFMELFIDAYDWVMVPNVYGMSQFADGGIFATKPYISGSNYILKMSDFKKGQWCEVWNALFWNFINQHRLFFEKQPRLSVILGNLARMGPSKTKNIRLQASEFLNSLS
jgi:deoxyribodipyrimidine photolyase-related protein